MPTLAHQKEMEKKAKKEKGYDGFGVDEGDGVDEDDVRWLGSWQNGAEGKRTARATTGEL